MQRALIVLIALVAACKSDAGGTCDVSADCNDELRCADWDALHQELLGDCAGDKCCVTDQQEDEVEDERRKRRPKRPPSKLSQCNRLIAVINKAQAPIKNAAGADVTALRTLSGALEGVAVTVTATKLSDAKLIGFRDDYAKMARSLGGAARDVADALEGKDATKSAAAAKTMSSMGERESKIVDDINTYCQK